MNADRKRDRGPGIVPAAAVAQREAEVKAEQAAARERDRRIAAERGQRERARREEDRERRLAEAERRWGADNLQPDSRELLKALDDLGIGILFQVTSVDNLGSIFTHGICSLHRLDSLGIIQRDIHGYGRIEKARELSSHVATSLVPHVGMASKVASPVALLINPIVLLGRGTLCFAKNSARSDVNVTSRARRDSVSGLSELFDPLKPGRRRDPQAEVWVPNSIDVDLILGVVAGSDEVLARAREAAAWSATSGERAIRWVVIPRLLHVWRHTPMQSPVAPVPDDTEPPF